MVRTIARHVRRCTGIGVLLLSQSASAGGILGMDHRIGYDDSGIWGRRPQKIILESMITAEIMTGLWEGGDSRLGRTSWQAIDASILTAVSTEVMKRTFRRVRPSNTDNPDAWFKSSHDRSFPSGEVAAMSAIVTPFILEYHDEHPWVYGLEALPVYVGIARMKTRGHWQSDVVAGFLVGTAIGYYTHRRNSSFTLSLMPDGVQVGYRTKW